MPDPGEFARHRRTEGIPQGCSPSLRQSDEDHAGPPYGPRPKARIQVELPLPHALPAKSSPAWKGQLISRSAPRPAPSRQRARAMGCKAFERAGAAAHSVARTNNRRHRAQPRFHQSPGFGTAVQPCRQTASEHDGHRMRRLHAQPKGPVRMSGAGPGSGRRNFVGSGSYPSIASRAFRRTSGKL